MVYLIRTQDGAQLKMDNDLQNCFMLSPPGDSPNPHTGSTHPEPTLPHPLTPNPVPHPLIPDPSPPGPTPLPPTTPSAVVKLLSEQVLRDIKLLQSFNLMDYSLLVGVKRQNFEIINNSPTTDGSTGKHPFNPR
jgi:hypothetical protein